MSVEIDVRNDRVYTKTHEWVLVEGDIASVGISDYAQKELGDLVYAEAEPVGSELSKGDVIASVESVKMAEDVYTPVSGEIVEANESIEDAPDQLNSAPYDTWIAKVKLSDPSELDELLKPDDYRKLCEEAQ